MRIASGCSRRRSRSAASSTRPGAVEGFARDLGVELEPRALARARDELEVRTRLAAEEDVTGVPTLMLDDFPFGGIQSRETTRLVLERWVRGAAARGRMAP